MGVGRYKDREKVSFFGEPLYVHGAGGRWSIGSMEDISKVVDACQRIR